MRGIILIFSCFLMMACTKEVHWKTIAYHDGGEKKQENGYYVSGKDSVLCAQKVFYPNGQVQMEGEIKDDKREGKWESYFQDGQPWSITHFKEGLKHGKTKVWWKSNVIRYTGAYKHDEKDGEWRLYDEEGKFLKSVKYPLDKE